MPKLPVVSADDTIRALRRRDFVVDHQTGSHITLIHPGTNRRTVGPATAEETSEQARYARSSATQA